MQTMWLPPPTSLLSSHELSQYPSVLQQTHRPHPQCTITSNISQHPSHHLPIHPPSTFPYPPISSSSSPHNPTLVRRRKTIYKSPSHCPKKLFHCPYPGCTQASSNKGNLTKHIATRHEHRKDFECPFNGCKRKFAKKYNMLRHLSASGVHRLPKSYSPREKAKWTAMELEIANFLSQHCRRGIL